MFARNALARSTGAFRSFSTTRPSNLAKITLVGRLGASPQAAKDKQGREILIYSVATTDRPTQSADGTRGEPTTAWHRVLSYNSGGREYLSTLPSGTLVHIEADFKKRTIKNDAGEYNDQTLLLMKNIDVLQRPKDKDAEAPAS